eukprot:TRINITY_DN34895_c0_g1_i1.p1 TRINITY_DN34895_c0_g1~~TRINITY_DN34895_c0_g1_i1.p1  ORF type:complete len:412 (+),score=74.40 TRINITY_DN34895_c0_g1_i1:854-2089(+)
MRAGRQTVTSTGVSSSVAMSVPMQRQKNTKKPKDPAKLDLRDPKVQAMLDVRPGPHDFQDEDDDWEQPATESDVVDVPARRPVPSGNCSRTSKNEEEEEEDRGGGFINLDMKQFGTGSMEDPLKHAMSMRSAQDAKKMQLWTSWPALFQNTIFHGEQDPQIKAFRHCDSAAWQERLDFTTALKEEGNVLLKDGDLEKAIERYEKAAGVLRFVECVRPNWKNDDGSYKGIEDQWLQVDASALDGDSHEAAAARTLVTSCYLNIALATYRQKRWDVSVAACSEVLEHVDPSNVKARYRRAQARVAPTSAMDADKDAAIHDLSEAAHLAPQDRAVRELLTTLREERKIQAKRDRDQFSGLFGRGHVVTTDPRLEGERPNPSKLDLRDPRVQNLLDVRPGPGIYQDKEYAKAFGG